MEYGPEFDDGFDLVDYIYVIPDPKVGSTVSSYSSTGLAKAFIETKSPVVKKAGAFVTAFDMETVIILFGELT